MKLKVIACEIFFREICAEVASGTAVCDLEFLPKGLHDLGSDRMAARLRERIDATPAGRYEAIALAYGLCNNGLAGLSCAHTPLVLPRAHDCITVFLGSRARYRAQFESRPGTYFRTPGWLEREDPSGADDMTVQQRLGLFLQFEDLVRKYGEDNARYIADTLGDATAHYDRIAYIRMGLDGEARFVEQARAEAARRGWTFEELPGDRTLLRKLVNGQWDDDFLVVPPGRRIRASHDDDVVAADS